MYQGVRRLFTNTCRGSRWLATFVSGLIDPLMRVKMWPRQECRVYMMSVWLVLSINGDWLAVAEYRIGAPTMRELDGQTPIGRCSRSPRDSARRRITPVGVQRW